LSSRIFDQNKRTRTNQHPLLAGTTLSWMMITITQTVKVCLFAIFLLVAKSTAKREDQVGTCRAYNGTECEGVVLYNIFLRHGQTQAGLEKTMACELGSGMGGF
jgi:hypothetical protein